MRMRLPEPLGGLLGELEPGAITNLYGQPGTGKTNLCILAALDCIRGGGKVLFIDTEGGLSKERALQISNSPDMLKSVILLEPRTLKEQELAVRKAEQSDARLIILDSAVALYRIEHAELAEGIQERDRKNRMDTLLGASRSLSRQMSVLSKIAKDRNIPVLITAHAFRNWDSGELEVVGGDAIRYWSKTMVHLEKTGKTSERRATIVKHRAREENNSVKFLLVNEGIKPSKGFGLF
ncbi:MAG: DNA repair and recombination protein RadB [Candidatus Aenigmarchaeota archaeon]|nr:DNA repair and recombination protein RadB [Candidatus Aenigmarchaeota archaeon]